MNSSTKDPLLGAAKVIVVLLMIMVIFAMVMIGIGIGAVVSVERAEVLAKLAEAGAPNMAFAFLIVAMALVIVLLSLAYKFFEQLGRIIDSVKAGDPFHAENARRLALMGWISVGGHGVALALAGLSKWFKPFLEKVGEFTDIGFEVDPTGILLTLILFILARVFKRGAEMREELEGTV
ncbi:MAG: hypothetical protein C0515_07420 [Novosphingobium sp.]|nr:hypothetical protein [Novosphingobium sp.]MBX9644728.1 DUF2975 domain-containing protein [Novosphingobium sp.]